MKRMRSIALLVVLGVVLSIGINSMAFAQSTTEDDRIVVKKSDLPPSILKQLEAQEQIQQLEKYGEWAGKGREVGEAIRGGLSALTDEANRLANTRVGTITIWFIGYKVMGGKLIRLTFGLLLFLILFPTFLWIYRNDCMARRILEKEVVDPATGKVTARQYDVFEPEAEKRLVYGYTFLFVLMILILIIVV